MNIQKSSSTLGDERRGPNYCLAQRQSFLPRCAYAGTAEVSVYVRETFAAAASQEVYSTKRSRAHLCSRSRLIGHIFAHNEPSLRLFANVDLNAGFAPNSRSSRRSTRSGHRWAPRCARMSGFGFTAAELRTVRTLKTAAGIQRFLDQLPKPWLYARSPRNVLRDRTVPASKAPFSPPRPCGSSFSSAHLRFGSGSRHRSRHHNFQSARTLGRGCEIEFHRLPYRNRFTAPCASCAELLQHLFQSAI